MKILFHKIKIKQAPGQQTPGSPLLNRTGAVTPQPTVELANNNNHPQQQQNAIISSSSTSAHSAVSRWATFRDKQQQIAKIGVGGGNTTG